MYELNDELNKLPMWEHFDDKQKEFVSQNAYIKHYKKGTIIQGWKSSCLGFVLVLKGNLRVYLLSDEGREVTLYRLEKGAPCVLTASCVISQITFETQIIAEKDCDLLIINASALKRITTENIYARCYLFEMATERFSTVMWTMQQILFAKLDRRLAEFLLSETEKTNSNSLFMTHDEIAKHISSAREVVARMLKRFANDGIVELKRGTILIKDRNALQRV